MKNVLKMKSVKMIAALVLVILLAASLIPAQAQAEEAKWYKGEPGYDFDNKAKIGGGYFWFDYEYTDDSSSMILYYSAKKSGEGVKLGSVECGKFEYGKTIMFNGNKVYFTSQVPYYEVGENPGKVKIHYATKSGKTKKTLKTITLKDDCVYSELLNVYNGRLYFTRYNKDWEGHVTEGMLFSMNTSGDSYKVTRHSSDFPCADAAGNSRYIYAKAWNGEYYGQSNPLKVFDCKEKKVVRTIKNVYKYVCSGSKLYYAVSAGENGGKIIYTASASGKDKKKVLDLGENYGYGNLFKDSVYYYDRNGGVYYKYNLAKGTKTEIDEMSFMMCLGPMGM